jgi:hypothetical protein
MHPTESRLAAAGYTTDAVFSHYDLIPFVVKYLFRKNTITLSWLMIMVAFFMWWIAAIVDGCFYGTFTFGSVLFDSGIGFFFTFLLIPVHELLHGIAYKICGASHVAYKANWRQLYFMAVADGFVARRKPFYFIGSLPFIVISTALLVPVFYTDPGIRLALLSALWLHASMCAGDIGLMSFFAENRRRDVVTFDDVPGGKAYFMSRNIPRL